MVSELREAARRGDWSSANELATALAGTLPPQTPQALGEYLHDLKDALNVARAARAHAAASLVRLHAAAGFQHAAGQPGCQDIAEPPDL